MSIGVKYKEFALLMYFVLYHLRKVVFILQGGVPYVYVTPKVFQVFYFLSNSVKLFINSISSDEYGFPFL